MATQLFDGGATGTFTLSSGTGNVYVEDAVVWNRGNLDLAGQYRVRVDAISPSGAASWDYYRLNVGGADYAVGGVVVNQNTTSATVRLYNGPGTATTQRTNASGAIDNVIRERNSGTSAITYTWTPAALAGSYSWTTVASAPGIGTPSVNKQAVTVTYTNSLDDGGAGPLTYKMQYSSNGGSTWSTAVTVTGGTHTFNLVQQTTYRFRVYATNTVGDGAATSSTSVTTDPAVRGRVYVSGAWRDLTVGFRYNGTSWVPLTVFRRYNGTTWQDLT